MIGSLKRAFELAENHSEEEQRTLAALLLQEMHAEQLWSASFADPRSTILLSRLVREALAEDAAEDTDTLQSQL